MYEVTIIVIISVGLIAALVFLLTWTPFAIHAQRQGLMKDVTWFDILDMVGFPLAITASCGFALYNVAVIGFQPNTPWTFTASRIISYGILSAMAILRLSRWAVVWRKSADGDGNIEGRVRDVGHRHP
jgi:hypothetical protein